MESAARTGTAFSPQPKTAPDSNETAMKKNTVGYVAISSPRREDAWKRRDRATPRPTSGQ